MRRILSRLAKLFSTQTWNHFLSRGDSWFFAGGHLYLLDTEGTTRVQESTRDHPYPGNNGRLFRKAFSKEEQVTGHQLGVLISGLGRFGNGIQQFLHARSFGTALTASPVLFFPNRNMSQDGLRGLSSSLLRPINGPFRNSELHAKSIWRSDFFDSGTRLHAFDQVSSREMLEVLRSLYQHLIDGEQHDNDTLTVHLRSGDVFGEKPHPAYGQPPLAFYERVIDSKSWKQLVVVAEDDSNPCLASLLAYASDRSVPTEVSGREFVDATLAISRSSHLVASRGTFVPAVVYLSKNAKVIYQFDEPVDKIPTTADNHYRTISDLGGGYVREIFGRNWHNTVTQRTLMTSYPKNNLSELPSKE